MPLTRFIGDLDELLDGFHGGDGDAEQGFENLRQAVARMNEIRRQLAAAENKLGAALALAESSLMAMEDAPARAMRDDRSASADDG